MSIDNIASINSPDEDIIDMLDYVINDMYDTCRQDKSYMMYVIQLYWSTMTHDEIKKAYDEKHHITDQ